MNADKQRPKVYHHKVKGKPLGFQRADANAVRARSKVAYRANPKLAKFLGALWAEKHREERRESVRKSRQRNLARSLERERAAWIKRRTPEELAKRAAYSRAWRLKKKLAAMRGRSEAQATG